MAVWISIKTQDGVSYVDLDKACHVKLTEAGSGQPPAASIFFDSDHRVSTADKEEVRKILAYVSGSQGPHAA